MSLRFLFVFVSLCLVLLWRVVDFIQEFFQNCFHMTFMHHFILKGADAEIVQIGIIILIFSILLIYVRNYRKL